MEVYSRALVSFIRWITVSEHVRVSQRSHRKQGVYLNDASACAEYLVVPDSKITAGKVADLVARLWKAMPEGADLEGYAIKLADNGILTITDTYPNFSYTRWILDRARVHADFREFFYVVHKLLGLDDPEVESEHTEWLISLEQEITKPNPPPIQHIRRRIPRGQLPQ